MPVCRRCGEENPERAKFCLACGAPLGAAEPGPREERKRVTVLFCDLVGFTARAEQLDVEDVRGLLTPYYQRLRTELERFGGTVEKFIGDAVVAVFGAPVVHEDDPERAVRAAFSIREAIGELNAADETLDLHVRIGVTTGEALVAIDARPEQGEGMASGDVVNTAARLQAAAPIDGILVDGTTFRSTDRELVYEPAEPVSAKGKAEPVPVWSVVEPRAHLGVDVDHAPQTVLVGRERELELLLAALDRARSEQTAQLVTLLGVPGMGKSRLVWELGQKVDADSELITWRQGRCLPYGDGVALWALGEIVKAQAGVLDSDTADQAEAKLGRAVADLLPDEREAAWVREHLAPLVGLAGETARSGDRQSEGFAAWRRFCEALADQAPTVLVVEDLHWADELLLDFLDNLVDWADQVPLLVVATARPELLAQRPGWGGGKPNSTTVSLSPLGDADTTRLIGALLGRALLPAETQSALLSRCGGNPLYAEEYVRMLADRGHLRTVGGTVLLTRIDELPMPETVQGIIAARLDTLPASDKALLQDAAVVGKVGWLGALAALAGDVDVDAATLQERLHALERKELLRRERRSQVAGEHQYAFRHALIRDVAYQQLPRGARADKHRRVAEWLQGLAPDRAEDRAELLAHHWLAALEFARAAGQDTAPLLQLARPALRDAGDRAAGLHAYAAARRWYTAALELCPPADPERPRLLLRLGRADLVERSELPLLEEARDGLLAQGDQEGAAEAEAHLSRVTWRLGQGERSMQHAERAVELVRDAEPSTVKVTALVNLANAFVSAGRSEESIELARRAVAMAEPLGLEDLRAEALDILGDARFDSGDRDGLTDLEQAVAVAEAVGSPLSSRAYNNLGNVLIRLGDLGRGFEMQAKLAQDAERFGFMSAARHAQAEQTYQDYWQGRWDAAFAGADQFIATAATSPHYMERVCRQVRGLVRLARGEASGAESDARASVELAVETGDLEGILPALAVHARVLLATGDRDGAGGRIDELLSRIAERGPTPMNPDWSGPLAVALSDLGRGEELAELLADARIWTRWFAAATAFAAGEYVEAADTYAAMGSRADEAFARLRAAEHLLGTGRRASGTAQLQQALAFYREVRAVAFLRQVDDLGRTSALA